MMSSFVVMEKEEILELCENALERIQNGRERRRLSLIQKKIESRNWWRRWLWFLPPLTEESAKRLLESSDIFSEYHMVDLMYGRQESTIEDLAMLANNSIDGLLNVSAEDLRAVGK